MKKFIKLIYIILMTLTGYIIGTLIHVVSVMTALFFAILHLKFFVKMTVLVWANLLFLSVGKKLHIYGKENIEKGKNYLYVVNHSSLFDIPALMAIKPLIHWVGKETYAKIPFFGWFLLLTGYIPIKRESLRKAKNSIDRAAQDAMSNVSIGFFPEGTRSLDGQIKPFKRGFVFVLRNSNLDILPITFNGLYQLKPKKRFYVDPTAKTEAIIHKPLKNKDLIKLSDDKIIEKVRDIIAKDYSLKSSS